MKIIITENQKNLLLTEGITDGIIRGYKSMEKFTKNILSECKQITGMDFGFLLSWGATLGGLMMPVTQFIEGKYPELTSVDISLIVTGAMVTFYSSNKKSLSKILTEIKERGLIKVFDELLNATTKLKNTFLSFIESLNLTFFKMSNMLAYTFLIPILPQLYQMSQMGYDSVVMNEIIKRILGYGIVLGSSVIIKQLIKNY